MAFEVFDTVTFEICDTELNVLAFEVLELNPMFWHLKFLKMGKKEKLSRLVKQRYHSKHNPSHQYTNSTYTNRISRVGRFEMWNWIFYFVGNGMVCVDWDTNIWP